ncbi:MAG: DNA polymerase III subunit beta [Candidatus Eisenbacteria bacterium]|nr:DNA polymerase III subunit beta [Candidatus Eisenbacteria bacterium]
MKLKVLKSEFFRILQTVVGIVPARSTLPVLNNILIESENGKLLVTATDLDTTISTSTGKFMGEEPGQISVSARKVCDLVKELPEEVILLSGGETSLKLSWQKGSASFPGMPPADFPKLPTAKFETKVVFPALSLERAVRKSSYAAAVDQARPVLSGVLFQVFPTEVRLVATDGHRLARSSFTGKFPNVVKNETVIPPKALSYVTKLMGKESKDITFSIAKNHVKFDVGESIVYSRVLEGPFPNYEQVIPKETGKRLVVDREELMAAIRKVAIFSDSVTHQVKFALAKDVMTLSASTTDIGTAEEKLSASYAGDEMEIGYNAVYLLDMLGSMESREVNFGLNTPVTAAVLTPGEGKEGEDLLCLVMPLRLPEPSTV